MRTGSIDNLIGPPVGILGEGQLTGALRKCPSAVVLLDEFEKAHPRAIPDVFLGAFDKRATLSDTKSGLCADRTPCTRDDECGSADFCDRTVPTKDATFILTSNLGQAHATLFCSWLRWIVWPSFRKLSQTI